MRHEKGKHRIGSIPLHLGQCSQLHPSALRSHTLYCNTLGGKEAWVTKFKKNPWCWKGINFHFWMVSTAWWNWSLGAGVQGGTAHWAVVTYTSPVYVKAFTWCKLELCSLAVRALSKTLFVYLRTVNSKSWKNKKECGPIIFCRCFGLFFSEEFYKLLRGVKEK